jgi:hypothetical protein
MVTSEQVREALETQKMLAEKAGLLGEILVEMGWMDPMHYIEVVQDLTDKHEVATRDKIQEEFVTIALAKGYVTSERVREARLVQSTRTHRNKLIGQIMVEMGLIAPDDRDRILATYRDNDGD